MPNGARGDHPITDILFHGMVVYSPTVDGLVRDIIELGGRELIDRKLYLDYSPYHDPDIDRLEAELAALKAQLRTDATARGWEVE